MTTDGLTLAEQIQYSALQDRLGQISGELRAQDPRYAQLRYPQPAGLDDVQQALRPGEALVSYKSTYGGYLGQATGVYGILPSKLLQNAFKGANGAGTDLTKTPQTVDLTVGPGNAEAPRSNDVGKNTERA